MLKVKYSLFPFLIIFQQHFGRDQHHVFDTCKILIAGKIPELNLSFNNISSSNIKPRLSSESITIKKANQFTTIDIN